MVHKTAICERSGEQVQLSEGFIVASPKTGEWAFICKTAPDEYGDYAIKLSELVKSPEAFVNWMGHLNQKTWINHEKFFEFWTRFRQENGLFI